MSEVLEANPSEGTVTTGRVPLHTILEDSTVKRLQDHGYVLHHVDDDDSPASAQARASEAPTNGAAEDEPEATDELIEQGVAVAEKAAPSFYNRVKEEDERKVVRALHDFFVRGKKPRGVKMPKPEKDTD